MSEVRYGLCACPHCLAVYRRIVAEFDARDHRCGCNRCEFGLPLCEHFAREAS